MAKWFMTNVVQDKPRTYRRVSARRLKAILGNLPTLNYVRVLRLVIRKPRKSQMKGIHPIREPTIDVGLGEPIDDANEKSGGRLKAGVDKEFSVVVVDAPTHLLIRSLNRESIVFEGDSKCLSLNVVNRHIAGIDFAPHDVPLSTSGAVALAEETIRRLREFGWTILQQEGTVEDLIGKASTLPKHLSVNVVLAILVRGEERIDIAIRRIEGLPRLLREKRHTLAVMVSFSSLDLLRHLLQSRR